MTTDKRFFKLDDDGTYYLVVASSLTQAQKLMAATCCEFGHGAVWSELTLEQVAQKQRCHTEDERGVIKLAEASIGDWFSSEW